MFIKGESIAHGSVFTVCKTYVEFSLHISYIVSRSAKIIQSGIPHGDLGERESMNK